MRPPEVDDISFRDKPKEELSRMPVPLDRAYLAYEQRKKAEEDERQVRNKALVRSLRLKR